MPASDARGGLTTVVNDRIWTTERPVWFSGVRLRARTTVLRLDDGGLMLHSPAPVSDAQVAALGDLGPVRWLLVPNVFHHLGTPAAAERFPQARVVGPSSVSAKNEALKLDLTIWDPQFTREVPELESLPLEGVPFLDETVLYHRPTQTLLGADIVLCASASDHWTWRCAARLTGCYDRVRVPPDVRKKIVDAPAAARSLEAMLKRPFERLMVAHADTIEGDCHTELARAWRREGVAV